jgi:hypothetical protein
MVSPFQWEHLPVPVVDCGTLPSPVQIIVTAGHSDDPTEILRVVLQDPGPNPEMKMYPGDPFEVTVSNMEQPVTLADLRRISDRVNALVDRFRWAF